MARKPTEEVQLKLRFTEALRRKLAASADSNERSMNAEIIHRLEQSFLHTNFLALVEEKTQQAAKLATLNVKQELEQLVKDIVREKAGYTTLADLGKPRGQS